MEIVNLLGRRFFWEIETGNIIAERREMSGSLVETTKEQDFGKYTELQGLDPNAIEMITFEPGQYAEDFARADSWRFDPETKRIQFRYPDPNEPEPPEPVYQPPLTEQVKRLQDENTELKMAIAELAETNESDKIDMQLALTELAELVAGGGQVG